MSKKVNQIVNKQEQTVKLTTKVKHLIEDNSGFRLDIGCGANKMPGFIGIDMLDLPGVDIIHDLQKTPWPIPENTVQTAVCSHLVEHIDPTPLPSQIIGLVDLLRDKGLITDEEINLYIGDLILTPRFIAFMNEIWRVMKVGGELAIATPYAGSLGYFQDPSHSNPCNEFTWEYFDPIGPRTNGLFYTFYQPSPWKIKSCAYARNGNMETILVKRGEDPSYHQTPSDKASMRLG
jgi:hypothetical protein